MHSAVNMIVYIRRVDLSCQKATETITVVGTFEYYSFTHSSRDKLCDRAIGQVSNDYVECNASPQHQTNHTEK